MKNTEEKSEKEEAKREYEENTLHDPIKCEHEFKYMTALEIECMKCRVGYHIGSGDELKDGHLYHGGKLII